MAKQQRSQKTTQSPLNPADEAAIEGADEKTLRRLHDAAAAEESATEAAMKADEAVIAAKQKLKEATADYRQDLKVSRAKRRLCWQRLEQLGKA